MDNRIITTDVMEEDFSLEGNLRPQTLDEYIGQEKTKNTLKIYTSYLSLALRAAGFSFFVHVAY